MDGLINDIRFSLPLQAVTLIMAVKGKETGREPPDKFSESRLFHVRKTPFALQRGHNKKGTFVHLLKRAGV